MNLTWKNFLISQQANISAFGDITFAQPESHCEDNLYPISKLAVLRVSGADAATFLQGQCTCNIPDITESYGSFGAFCTPKGRTICTFFIIKQNTDFVLVITAELLEKISKRLRMYILRSDVQLNDRQDAWSVFGISCSDNTAATLDLPEQKYTVKNKLNSAIVHLPGNRKRFLMISATTLAIEYWSDLSKNKGFQPTNTDAWDYLDIQSGLPWLDAQTTEEYTPQMLNLDRLDGISFNKGCYTGQEIVARTHYLGKAKRQMYLAETRMQESPPLNLNVVSQSNDSLTQVGKIVAAGRQQEQVLMLLVMQSTDVAYNNLHLDNANQDKITYSEISY